MSAARVLVVDDDPWILRMVTATLEKRQYVVDTARDGKQALARAQSARPDLILTDVMMPVMDGWSFVQHLRSIPELSTVPVIFLTALGKDEARLRSLGLQPKDFLSKPFRFDELDRRVSEALAAAPANEAVPPAVPAAAAVPPAAGQAPYPGTPGYPPGYPGYPPGYPGYPPGYPQGYPGYPGYPPQYPGYPQGYGPYPPFPGGAPGFPGAAPGAVPGAPAAEPAAEGEKGRNTTAINGRLEQLGLSSLLVMMEMERKDGVLMLKEAASQAIGRIFLRQGQVVSAKIDREADLAGRESVYKMLSWQKGTFSFNAMEVDMDDEVRSSTTHLLMEGARLIDEANR